MVNITAHFPIPIPIIRRIYTVHVAHVLLWRTVQLQTENKMDDVVDNRFGAVVRINVGGEKIVEVARRTLTFFPDSMLGCMFSGRFEVLYDKDGNVFLDRPYKYFSYVIEYLRNGATPLSDLPEDPVFLRRLEYESSD